MREEVLDPNFSGEITFEEARELVTAGVPILYYDPDLNLRSLSMEPGPKAGYRRITRIEKGKLLIENEPNDSSNYEYTIHFTTGEPRIETGDGTGGKMWGYSYYKGRPNYEEPPGPTRFKPPSENT